MKISNQNLRTAKAVKLSGKCHCKGKFTCSVHLAIAEKLQRREESVFSVMSDELGVANAHVEHLRGALRIPPSFKHDEAWKLAEECYIASERMKLLQPELERIEKEFRRAAAFAHEIQKNATARDDRQGSGASAIVWERAANFLRALNAKVFPSDNTACMCEESSRPGMFAGGVRLRVNEFCQSLAAHIDKRKRKRKDKA